MRSSSSSSSSEPSAKKGKKGKGEKGKNKKAKKQKKEQKEQKREQKRERKEKERVERAEAWECDRSDAVRLLSQLLQIDPGSADELEEVFSALDGGETVNINGLENKQVKKKLRHLLQALRLAPSEGQAFRTADRRVSFTALYQSLLCKARRGGGGGVATADVGAATVEVPEEPSVVPTSPVVAENTAAEAGAPDELGATEGTPPPARRVVGPVRPMPTVASSGAAASTAGDDDMDEGGADGGPKLEGAERRGVDLDALDEAAQREAWMTQPHESMAGFFGEGGGPKKGERFAVKRSKKEQEEFEKMMKARGPSLLQQTQDGDFQGHREAAERAQKRLKSAQTPWGTTAQEQSRHRPFDPEQDLTVRKPITGTDFSKLVENSVTGLADRFGRGSVATSFL